MSSNWLIVMNATLVAKRVPLLRVLAKNRRRWTVGTKLPNTSYACWWIGHGKNSLCSLTDGHWLRMCLCILEGLMNDGRYVGKVARMSIERRLVSDKFRCRSFSGGPQLPNLRAILRAAPLRRHALDLESRDYRRYQLGSLANFFFQMNAQIVPNTWEHHRQIQQYVLTSSFRLPRSQKDRFWVMNLVI